MKDKILEVKDKIKKIQLKIDKLQKEQSELFSEIYKTVSENSNTFEELFNNAKSFNFIDSPYNMSTIINLFLQRLKKEKKIILFKGFKMVKRSRIMYDPYERNEDDFLTTANNIDKIKFDSLGNQFTGDLTVDIHFGTFTSIGINKSNVLIFDDAETAKLFMECKD